MSSRDKRTLQQAGGFSVLFDPASGKLGALPTDTVGQGPKAGEGLQLAPGWVAAVCHLVCHGGAVTGPQLCSFAWLFWFFSLS